jgi:hypothetical protein
MFSKSVALRLVCLAFLLSISSASLGSAFFQAPQTYNAGGWDTESIAVADVNRDGKPDLLVANICLGQSCSIDSQGMVGVLLGNGDGTFQAAQRYGTGGYYAWSIFVADVNGDGRPDLLAANSCFSDCDTGGVGVLLGNGDGTFQPAQTYRSGGHDATSIFVADVNGDGRPDIVVANYCHTDEDCQEPPIGKATGNVGVLLGNGNGTFQSALNYDSGGSVGLSVAAADLNRDGKVDLIVTNRCVEDDCTRGALGLLLGNGDGTFQPSVTFGAGGSRFYSMALADVNGDGAIDILTGDYFTVRVSLGNGDGTFQPPVAYAHGGEEAQSVAVGDVNGDGKPDVLAASKCEVGYGCFQGVIGVLLGNGDGTFQKPMVFGSYGVDATSIALADVNGDSRLDLLVANLCARLSDCHNEGSAVVFLNKAPIRTPPVITLSASPKVLWPPNGRMLPVTISGTITDTGSGVNLTSAAYAVKDEYGEIQPTGAITVGSGGIYSFTVLLQASRLGTDLDGRRYTVTVRAKDNAGSGGSKTSAVTVPHDQGD